MVQVVVLCANGERKSSKIADVSAAGIAKGTRKVKQPAILGTYTWGKQTLTLWGWTEGRAGTENKHELPPPHDKGLFFSDVIVTSSAGDFTVAAWNEFYDMAFKGFEDLGDEDTDSEGGEGEGVGADAEINGDAEGEGEEEDFDNEEDDDEEANVEGEDEGDGDGEGDDGSAAGSDDEEEEEEEEDDECYDSDEGGGGKRRAPRRRAMAAPEYRRMDMGLRSKIKLPAQVGRRAPRWQTGALLEPEP